MKKKRIPVWTRCYFVLGFICGMAGVFVWLAETGHVFPEILMLTLGFGSVAGLLAGVVLCLAMSMYHCKLC